MTTIYKIYNGTDLINIFWSSNYNRPAISIRNLANNENEIIPYDFKVLKDRLDLYNIVKSFMKFSVYANFIEKKFFIFYPEKNPRILPKFRSVDPSLLNNILSEVEQKSQLKLEEWQKEAIIEILKRSVAILKQETGTGKTIEALLTLEYYKRQNNQLNFLILTTTKEVVDQFFGEKEKWKLDIDLIKGENITYFRSFATKFKKEINEDLKNNKDEYLKLIKSQRIKDKIETSINSGKELGIKEIPYEIIYKFIEKNRKYQYDVLIVDEPQNVFSQSRGSKRTKIITKIVLSLTRYAKNILFMSATPTVNGEHETYNYLRALGFNVSDLTKYFYYNKRSKRKNKIIIENFFNTYESLYQYCFDIYNKVLYVNEESFKDKEKKLNINKNVIESKINERELLYIFRDNLVIPLARELEKLRRRKFSNKKEEDEEKVKAIMPILSQYISVISYYIDGFYYKEEFGDIRYINPEHPKMKDLIRVIRKHSDRKISIAIRNKNFRLFKQIIEKETGRKVYLLTGDDKELEDYKKDKKGILVFTIKTGGEGINLSDTDILIFYQYWWTFASLKQAMDRILRIDSPNKDKYIYFLISVPVFDEEDLERVIPDELLYFAKGLYEKGYISLDLWMRRRILDKQRLWEKEFVKDEKSIMEEIADEIAKLYYESENNERNNQQ